MLLQVRARLEAKERAVVGRAECEVELLEKDVEELRRRDEEISKLLQTEDNNYFLQVRGGGGASRTPYHLLRTSRSLWGCRSRTRQKNLIVDHVSVWSSINF